MRKYCLLFFVPLLFLSGCKKYSQDGSILELRTPKHRLCNHLWKFSTIGGIGASPGPVWCSPQLEFVKDGEFRGNASQYSSNAKLAFYGTWKFADDKNKLAITNGNTNITEFYTIKALTKDNLTLSTDSLNFMYVRNN